MDGGGKAKGKGKTKGKTFGQSANAKGEGKSTEGKEEKVEGKEEGDTKPSVKAERPVTSPKEEATGNTGNQEALMSEVTSLLRSIRVQASEPAVKAVQLRSIYEAGIHAHTLIDGGATHCLRQRKTQEEWAQASPVSVKLAAGETQMRQCSDTTTLLVEEPVQAIIPVAKVIDLGYVVHWDRDACRIEHVRHGRIPVEMSQGCPTVPREWGEKLMEEVEEAERKKGRLRAIMKLDVLAEDEHEKRIAELKATFPQVPIRILERNPGEKEWDPDQVPFNRRKRR